MKQLQLKKGSIPVYVVGLLVVLILMFMIKKCSTTTLSSDDHRASGDTLNVAIELSPLGISTREDTLSGFHYDLIRFLADKHNRPLQVTAFSVPSAAFGKLKSGRYDIVISDIPSTSRMKQEFIFTVPIYLDKQVLVRKHNESAEHTFELSHYSLAGDSVWVAEGSPFADRIRNLAHEIGDTIYVIDDHGYGIEQLGILTALGEIKQSVMNNEQAERLKNTYPDLDISTPISFNQFQGWALSRESEQLRDTINRWLDDFKTTREYKKLLKRYNLN